MTRLDLVVLSLEPWDDVWRRNQYLVDGLLRVEPELRVLFVEPANDLLHALVSGRGVRRGAGLRVADGYEGRLMLFQPDKLLPRFLGGLADALLRTALDRAQRTLAMCAPLIWINDPGWAALAARAPDRTIYDITDDWLRADRAPRQLRRVERNEAQLMRHCARVIVCSTGLVATKSRLRDVIHVPNGVEVSRYRTPAARPDDLPAGPTAVYVGTLHEDRLDVGLVIDTARTLHTEGGAVVLVGPNALSGENTELLRSEPGVRLLGARRRDLVPGYLQHADTLIVPHVVTGFTDSLDPIKLYEYRAVGRPIVSTPVAGFRDLDVAGVQVHDRSRFARAVLDVASADIATREFDDVPDWSERVTRFARVLREVRVESLGEPRSDGSSTSH